MRMRGGVMCVIAALKNVFLWLLHNAELRRAADVL